MLRYTLRQLEYAIAVADHSSVAAAAEMLGIAQPTVSAAIIKLEEQLGVQLFLRHHAQGVSPTPLGHRFLTEARSLVAHANEFQREAESAGTAISGELRIASFLTMAPAFVPGLIEQFQRRYPLISLA